MLLTLDEGSRAPKSRQVLKALQDLLASGALGTGERLPSTRHLAEQLGVHRSTVASAYQELWAQGWIELKAGARPTVRARLHHPAPQDLEAQVAPWSRLLSDIGEDRSPRPPSDADIIQLSRLDVDPALMPVDAFRSALQRMLRRHGTDLLGYGPWEGLTGLRTWIARRMETHGVKVGSDSVLITSGAQQALDLVFRALGPGRRVLVESPTYNLALPLLRLNGLEPIPAPMGTEGLDLATLPGLLHTIDLVYTMPSFQNPTGLSTSRGHRECLLSLCAQHGVPVLEDGFEEEMKYFGRAIQPLKALDRHGVVAYAGTFSKILFPGLRLGWIAASPPVVQRLATLRHLTDLGPPPPLQAGLLRFCEEGHFDAHLGRMHRTFRRRMHAALRALRQEVSREWAHWEEPLGGYLIWMRLKTPPHPVTWASHFRAHGVEVTLGDAFFATPPPATFLRLSISSVSETALQEGIRRLGAALRSAHDA